MASAFRRLSFPSVNVAMVGPQKSEEPGIAHSSAGFSMAKTRDGWC